MRVVTLSGKEIFLNEVNQFGYKDNPTPLQRKAVPFDEISMDGYYYNNAELSQLQGLLELNPGSQLYAHLGTTTSSGFWVPVELEEE